MLYKEISRVLSFYLLYLALALGVALGVSAYYEFFVAPEAHPQPHTTMAFVYSILIDLGLAGIFRLIGHSAVGRLHRREGLAIVVLIWFITAIVGGLPFYISKTFESPVDSYFEARSGLTTTGASLMLPKKYHEDSGNELPYHKNISGPYENEYIYYGTITPVRDSEGDVTIEGIEAVSKGILFWRSFMQWLGGMGVVVLFVAILPALGVGGKVLFHAEATGPFAESVTPRIKETASLLWKIYLGLTVMETSLLMITNKAITFFEAITITFSTLSTGGFCVRNDSIGSFASPSMEWIILFFMIAGATNFALYFYCLKGKFYRLKDPEFYLFIAIICGGAIFMMANLMGTEKELLTGETMAFGRWESLRYGMFQLLSAQTSTGFATANFNTWPLDCQALMIIVMFIGGMSGSTSGGMKIIRFYMVNNIIYRKVESIFKPEIVHTFKVRNTTVDDSMAMTVLSFLIILLFLAAIGTFLFIIDGVGPETALSIVACMLNNVGIAFRVAGPTESFAFLSVFGKILGSIWMVLGRLELFAVLILFLPSFWRK